MVREVPGYGSGTGVARVFAIDAETARYEESVRIALEQGGILNGTQCYLYRRRREAPGQLDVLFCETAEQFHALEFREEGGLWLASARFLCGADEYDSEYVLEEKGWKVSHAVRGPRKDYRIETVYRRARVGPLLWRGRLRGWNDAGGYFFSVR